LFDVDNLDDGTDDYGAPSPGLPLRATVDALSGGFAGLRIIYNDPQGSHGVGPGDDGTSFPSNLYGINLMSRYLFTGGKDLPDDPCLARNDCEYIAPPIDSE
jgi:hypothetical protein